MRRRITLTLLAAGLSLAAGAAVAPAADAAGAKRHPRCGVRSAELSVRVVPTLAGVPFTVGGRTFSSDRHGLARITLGACADYRLRVASSVRSGRERRGRFARWGDNIFTPERTVELRRSVRLEVGFEVDRLVRETFVDLSGRPLATARVSSVSQSNSLGSLETFAPGAARWLAASRTIRRSNGLSPTPILYSVQRVVIDGTNVVRKAQQRFYPAFTRSVRIRLLLYSARISAKDRLFGFAVGRGIELRYPDGHVKRYRFGRGSSVLLKSLPRGTYHVTVDANGLTSSVPIALTRNQTVELKVVSDLDLVVFFGTLFGGAAGLVLIGRPRLRARLDVRDRINTLIRPIALALLGAALLLLCGAATGHAAAPASAVPTYAYYYIWFDHGSWARAKRDYPLLGRYSSSDVAVMRKHVAWAKEAGLDGFIVSWKSTPVLNRRLAGLVDIAAAQNFKLAIIYQGLDFEREPLPVRRVASDLRRFARTYGANPVFHAFGKPVVIWSGTWRFTRRQIASVSRRVRSKIFLLASEKSAEGYARLARAVDGDAYYWSSVNPGTFPGYDEKLAEMGAAVHARNGLWIAPAAPGFDARFVGGSTVVTRAGGATLAREYAAALGSAPDAVGVISWNEFSENSHVEPSIEHGRSSLHALADILGGSVSARTDFDSNDPPGSQIGYGLPLISGLGFIAFTSLLVRIWRREIRNAAQKSP